MSYHKLTIVAGYDSGGKSVALSRNGHWKPETAAILAQRAGIVRGAEMMHQTFDMSGRGRNGQTLRAALPLPGREEKP